MGEWNGGRARQFRIVARPHHPAHNLATPSHFIARSGFPLQFPKEQVVPQRILSISGLRGVIGDGLEPTYLVEFAAALGTLAQGGPIVVSRDGRSTGSLVKHAVL